MTTAPPGLAEVPGAVPLLGHGWPLWRRPFDFLKSFYGTCDVAVLRIAGRDAFLLVSPAAVREVLVTRNRDFGKGIVFEKAKSLLGNSIVSSEGDFHLRQRRLMQPAFHQARLAGYTENFRAVAQEAIDAWQDGTVIPVDREMFKMSAVSAARCLFSSHQKAGEAAAVTARAMPVLVRGVLLRAMTPTSLPYRVPLPANRRYDAALRDMHKLIDEIITDYQCDDTGRDDLLSMLLAAKDEATGASMTSDQVHDEVCGILAASAETTARALAWAFHVLGTDPRIEEKVHEELSDVLRGQLIRYEDIARLGYVRGLVDEVLRYYSPGFIFTRSPHAEITIGDHRIPAGAIVLYSPYLLHHDPAVFPEPGRFDPERWSSPQAEQAARLSYIPFGAGPHQCIGASFAITEIITVIATVASRWYMRPASARPVQPRAFVTCAPSHLPMIVRRRI